MMKIIIGVLIHVKSFLMEKACTNASVKGQSLADTLQKQVKKLGIDTKVQLDGQVPWFKCVGKGSTELNNRGGLVTNLKTDLYGGTTTLDLCGLYGYPGYSGCFSRFNVYQDASEYGCPPHCTDITNKVTNPTCSNICEPTDKGCCTWANGPTKCNSGTCAKWNADGNTYCCPTKDWANQADSSAYCINLSPGDSCKYDNQCIYNNCILNEKGDFYCGDECKPNTEDPNCCDWESGPSKCKSGVCAKWDGADDNTYCCPTSDWINEVDSAGDSSAYCINLSPDDSCRYDNQCKTNNCKDNQCSDQFMCKVGPSDTECCTWANGPTKCKSGVCAKWGKGDDNTYCCPTKDWINEWDSAYCSNLSKGDPCEYDNQCNSGSCKSNDNDDTYECA